MAELEPAASASAGVEAREENGTLVLYLSGELDVTNAEYVRSAVNAAMNGHAEQVIFDLADLEFMDSSGIALLISAAGQVRDVQVRNPSAVVRRLIQLTGLAGTLRIAP
jgi:anti-anti-sigma factor